MVSQARQRRQARRPNFLPNANSCWPRRPTRVLVQPRKDSWTGTDAQVRKGDGCQWRGSDAAKLLADPDGQHLSSPLVDVQGFFVTWFSALRCKEAKLLTRGSHWPCLHVAEVSRAK